MVIADLHVHTTNSDGTLTLETIPAAAADADLDAVAVTDHDRLHPELDEPVTTVDGIELVHGIELRVETENSRVDLLGYGVHRTERIESLVEGLQRNRIERARKIVECVEDELGVGLDVDFEPGVGRPHIARAIDESEAPYGYQAAFDEFIGNGCPCYVARDIPSFEEGLACLDAACGVVGLAHPLRYDDPEGALAVAPELDAIELDYPYSRSVDTTRVEEVAEEHDLLVTGGSDAHNETLGVAGLDSGEYATVRERIRATA